MTARLRASAPRAGAAASSSASSLGGGAAAAPHRSEASTVSPASPAAPVREASGWIATHVGPYLEASHAREGLQLVARHTGVPVLLVAALALVLSFRLARRMTRLFVEVSVAAALVFALTRLGLITW